VVRSAATIYVTDLDTMSVFYQQCFGLIEVARATGDYCILESDAWTLALVRASGIEASSIKINDPPRRRTDTPIKLGFAVVDIDACRSAVRRLGGLAEAAEQDWQFRGVLHGDVVDPEGNVVQLRQELPEPLG
jgi:predicted enzyme related to lactoylglutathione lyase